MSDKMPLIKIPKNKTLDMMFGQKGHTAVIEAQRDADLKVYQERLKQEALELNELAHHVCLHFCRGSYRVCDKTCYPVARLELCIASLRREAGEEHKANKNN